jgi:hypothetical protein
MRLSLDPVWGLWHWPLVAEPFQAQVAVSGEAVAR